MKNKIIVLLFIIYIFTFSILGIIFKDNEISLTERRKLQTFPKFTLDSEYIEKIDKYLLDHFPYRDSFRGIKASYNYNILDKLDNNGIYLKDNYIFKSEYPTNIESINKFIDNINDTKSNFKNSNMYIMIIPDKNYYLDDDNFLHIDYEYIYNEVDKLDINKIDIRNIMTMEDYYETDTHWKQEYLDKVIKEMSRVMNFKYRSDSYIENIYNNFYGVYYGESAVNRNPEKLTYLTNNNINSLYVDYLENDKLHSIYNLSKLDSTDSYEVFLDGASSFIEIYNNNTNSKKELIVFRDSFGSSLIPLLTNYYKKITVIDNRYIDSNNYLKLLDINNQDILFIYSTLIVNNSGSLKG